MKLKNAGLAAVFSFFIPGLGQIYNGEFWKALGFIVASIVCALLSPVVIGLVIIIPVCIWAIIDAYNSAERINEIDSVEELES